jgi:hypothetical protein
MDKCECGHVELAHHYDGTCLARVVIKTDGDKRKLGNAAKCPCKEFRRAE